MCYLLSFFILHNYVPICSDIDLQQLKQVFGPSNEFIKSLDQHNMPNKTEGGESSTMLQEARILASCSFEEHTKWGKEARANSVFTAKF